MKKVTIILTGVILMTIGTLSVNAQSSATASSTATLITPISISNVDDLEFGTIASSATAGTVEIAFDNTATATGGVTLMSSGATRTSAKFNVVGEGTSTVNISFPTSVLLTSGGGQTLTVDGITSVVGNTGSTFNLVAGNRQIALSAVLNVPANTVAGVYANADDLEVTVNYE